MLHIQDPAVRAHLFEGGFGLEKESLRVLPCGHFSHTPDPFAGDEHIARDFCENQTEINTPVCPTPQAAVDSLWQHTCRIQRALAALPQPELLWPFSNPPYIRSEADIPIARFTGPLAEKTRYRQYLSDRYGRYKMTLCGVHINFSFAPALLRAGHAADGGTRPFAEYRDRLYVALAEQAAACGWLLTALTAASPLLDSSFVEKGRYGEDEFCGMASVRCSELGYWNAFAATFDYRDVRAYAASAQRYMDKGLLVAPSELYYPIRLKPRGPNDLRALAEQGVDHVELRMVDLNPFAPAGLDVRDLQFTQLLLLWLAAVPRPPLGLADQVQAVQNFKNAAHYDLKTVKIAAPGGAVCTVADAGLRLLAAMREFYAALAGAGALPAWVEPVLAFEEQKLIDPETRYAWRVRRRFAGGFVQKGLAHAAALQRRALAGAEAGEPAPQGAPA